MLLGSCFEETYRRYEPFVQMLEEQAAVLPAADLCRRPGPASAALAVIAPGLAATIDGVAPAAEAGDPAAAPVEVFDAMAGYLSRTAVAGPVLLVVEDLHRSMSTTPGDHLPSSATKRARTVYSWWSRPGMRGPTSPNLSHCMRVDGLAGYRGPTRGDPVSAARAWWRPSDVAGGSQPGRGGS